MYRTLSEYTEITEEAIAKYLPKSDPSARNAGLVEAMRYSVQNGGKRIRPVLTLAFCSLCGGDIESAVPFACAVEMVHTYSMIHDDLPCMDNDSMRRGKKASHIVYGEDIALLAGDALLTKAFEVATSVNDLEKAAKAAKVLSHMAGANAMVGGQYIDIKIEGLDADLDTIKEMVMGKTVALIKAACQMGCIAAGAGENEMNSASKYAQGLGMAFQIRDDILDVTGDSVVLGKNIGSDYANAKSNYVSMLGINRSQELVEEYTQCAVDALNGFTGNGEFLRQLAKMLVGRKN